MDGPSSYLPAPLLKFFALFPLHTFPPIENPYSHTVTQPTLWIHPPRDPKIGSLRSDVECLKWQAYLVLRGITDFDLRWDVAAEAGADGRLPTLQLPENRLLPAHKLPGWADAIQNVTTNDDLEGYIDVETRDESCAWVVLLEGVVHSQLVRGATLPYLPYI